MNSFELFITQLWQIAAVVVLIYAAVRWFASDRPHLAHALWAIVLFKCLVPPLWSSSLSPFTWICTAAQRFSSPDEITVQPIPRLSSEIANDGAGERDSQWTLRKVATDGQIHSYVFTPPPSNSSTFAESKWLQVLFWAWIGTVAVASLSMLIRYVCLLVWLARAKSIEDPRSQKFFLQTTRKLQLKRRVQLRVLEYPLGPAVLGILRPTVLLPKMIVDRMSDSELEALIAHELVHLRRGDLVWGGLQTIASCLWWFHPGIWFANRMLSLESERSCDEETIALLDCDVKEYAKCLLTVLEHKHRLQVAPELPGVRPMQITANRLERIMRLPHGCRASRSKWIWGWLILGCCLLLPGAAFVVAHPPSTMPTFVPLPILPTTEPTSAATVASWSAHSGLRVTPSPIAVDSGPAVLTVYRVGSALDKLVEHRNKSICAAAGIDPSLIDTDKLREQSRTQLVTTLKAAKDRLDEVSVSPQAESMAWEGDNLIVRATEIRHASIRAQLDSISKYGFHQVLIKVHLLSSSSELDIEGLSWTSPLTMLNNDQAEALISFGNTDRRARMLYEPSLLVSNGESGELESLNERPVTARPDANGTSTVETLSAGCRVRVEPLLMEGGKVRLSYESEYSKFVPMESPPGSNLPPRRRMVSFFTMVDDLINNDAVNFAGLDILHQLAVRRSIEVATRESTVVITFGQADPAFGLLASDV